MKAPPPDPELEPGQERNDQLIATEPKSRPVTALVRSVWQPVPIRPPRIDPHLPGLHWPERAAEVTRFTLLRFEHWISPSGWLREWIRACLWLAVVLIVAAVLIVPPVTALLEGVRDWTGLVSATMTNVNTAISAMPPIVLALATAFLAVRLIRRHRANRQPDRHHPYEHYN